MTDYEYQFTAKVDIHDFGRMAYTVAYASASIVQKVRLGKNPRLRIQGLVAGRPFHGAFQPAGENRFYLILSKRFCKSAGIALGEKVTVSFDIADQDAVEVPRALEHALNANDRARKIWDSISSGKKRGFAYRVASAKRLGTIENRVEEVVSLLLALKEKSN